jgi:hypothetical protein
LLAAIVIFAAVAPGILMTAPAVAAQLASEWQLTPADRLSFLRRAGAMSLATLPAWWWMSRLDWRRVALCACAVFLVANLVSAAVTQYETLLIGALHRLAGGRHADDPVYQLRGRNAESFAGVCLLGAGTTAAGDGGPAGVARPVCQLWPEGGVSDPRRHHALLSAAGPGLSSALSADVGLPPAAVDGAVASGAGGAGGAHFYISLSAVWTFIGTIGSAAGLSPAQVGWCWRRRRFAALSAPAARPCAARGARPDTGLAGLRPADRQRLAAGQPSAAGALRLAALLFKFTWTFVLPFILARVAGLDNNGRLMNSINLVIGGGMAAGPALAGALLQRFSSADALLAAAGGCALISAGLILAASVRREELAHGRIE